MGDPFGLVADESDYLIHPAKIAKGEGIRFYGDYRFTYTGVMDWDYNLDEFTTAGVLNTFYHYDGSGQEYKHNALVGAAFPLLSLVPGQGAVGAGPSWPPRPGRSPDGCKWWRECRCGRCSPAFRPSSRAVR